MANNHIYFTNDEKVNRLLTRWDFLLLIFICSLLVFLGLAAQQMATPYAIGEPLPLSLLPQKLPIYALRTVLRMFIALMFAILFSFIFGTLAAKNRRAELLIIPAIDILQAVPVLSFLAITVIGFIHLFPGSLLGPECAAIFVIFTAQVWNITFSFYQSLKTIPHDLYEAAVMFQLSPWQRFWKIDVPYSMSGLLWNIMMSMSASWFFVVLSEAIVVAHQEIRLPGVGSYIALAIEQHDLQAVGYAIITMMVVIFLYDQILFRPLIAWSEKFKVEYAADEAEAQSWFLDLIRRSYYLRVFDYGLCVLRDKFINGSCRHLFGTKILPKHSSSERSTLHYCCNAAISLLLGAALYGLIGYIITQINGREILHVMFLGAMTGSRVIVMILLSSLIWIPVGVWVGLRPHWVQALQPVIQFAAAFPANLFYPLFVVAIVRFHLNVEIWVTPLMILGTQWYILFNVIAGTSKIPRDLCLMADNMGLKGWLWWRRFALPAIFPFYITGAITAAGGAWNASIVAEWLSWGPVVLKATGLGAYIQASTLTGHFPGIVMGTVMMCLYVLLFNQILWRPLHRMAYTRFNIH